MRRLCSRQRSHEAKETGWTDSPRFGAEAVPGQLEELKAQTQENRVLVPDGPHQNTEEQGLTQGDDGTR